MWGCPVCAASAHVLSAVRDARESKAYGLIISTTPSDYSDGPMEDPTLAIAPSSAPAAASPAPGEESVGHAFPMVDGPNDGSRAPLGGTARDNTTTTPTRRQSEAPETPGQAGLRRRDARDDMILRIGERTEDLEAELFALQAQVRRDHLHQRQMRTTTGTTSPTVSTRGKQASLVGGVRTGERRHTHGR